MKCCRIIFAGFLIGSTCIFASTTISAQSLLSRPENAQTYYGISADVPTGLDRVAGDFCGYIAGEYGEIPILGYVGLGGFGAEASSEAVRGGFGLVFGLETNFRYAAEPILGIALLSSFFGDTFADHPLGLNPYVGYRVNLLDMMYLEFVVGDLTVFGEASTGSAFPSFDSGNGVVLGIRAGIRKE